MATLEQVRNHNHKSLKKYPDVLTVPQVQQILSVGQYSVYKLIKDGTLHSLKVGHGYRIVKQSLLDYIYGGDLNETA